MTTSNPSASDAAFFAPGSGRYRPAAIALHWLIATLILIQIGLGWYMNKVLPDHSPAQDRIQDLHISLGLTILMLILARIAVRLAMPPPRPVEGLAPWERVLSNAVHLLFYVLMLALPLTGWALLTVRHQPIHFWGAAWPGLPGLEGAMGPDQRPFRKTLNDIHTDTLVWIILANLALHVAGALKHQFDGHPVLWRMLPFLKRPAD
jgi:cytochrome b561